MPKVKPVLIGWLGAILLISPSLSIAQETSRIPQLHQEYLQALRFIGDQQYDKAVLALERIIKKEPTFHQAYIKLVVAHKEKKALDEAENYFKNLIAVNPENPYAYYGLGLVWKEKKAYDQAVETMMKAVQLSPGQPRFSR
ncbi:MAG: tetratricopeptide repeat protein, partial [candidate division KSB1 bacterium]|nr:tetratricopeptide repeat protein [candidate division KSB1 bacterium]